MGNTMISGAARGLLGFAWSLRDAIQRRDAELCGNLWHKAPPCASERSSDFFLRACLRGSASKITLSGFPPTSTTTPSWQELCGERSFPTLQNLEICRADSEAAGGIDRPDFQPVLTRSKRLNRHTQAGGHYG